MLLEVGLGSVGHDKAASLLLDSAGQRESNLGVMHLLDQGAAGLACGHSLAPGIKESQIFCLRKNLKNSLMLV